MARSTTSATRTRIAFATALLTAGMLAALAALLAGPQASAARATAACPSFRVLGNDRIGQAVLPKGTYSVKVFGGFSCSHASSRFTRFLQDYDGKLPDHWAVVPSGRGKAAFTHGGKQRFAVSLGGGGGGGGHHPHNPTGTRCPGTFKVLHDDRIGPLSFPKGSYLLYVPSGSTVSCQSASKLFTRFLDRPDGSLPGQWRIKGQTAIFYKRSSPRQFRFRVDRGA
jgi:hypothetical protein